ncbi:hypothetical protein ACYFX5_15750 [Bremerella sp. T1]|uniref:hypothetical protein n=1 Tax=Bremerella sp. TYQ1 TaxID=3119568 RepID=UPI001CCF3A7B|nr:hypothetical protein [Bremerella volcania]UBM34510.1 hypothetical protein LA756_17700 [Bremerella volcania]
MNDLLVNTPLPGTLSYGDFTFGPDGTTPPQLSVSSTVRYDEAARVVIGIEYLLEVEAIIVDITETATADRLETLRQQLQRPGQSLQITGLGFGDLQIDGDTQFGPKPQSVQLVPIAGTTSWQLRWKVAFTVIEGAETASGDWLAINFRSQYTIDQRGFTTRTIRGHVQIVSKRDGLGGIETTADSVRDAITMALPTGFRRERSTWTEDESKTRLEFEMVDRELDHLPFPVGIVDGEVDVTTQQQTIPQTKAVARLEGWLEASPEYPHHHAAERLLLIAADRAAKLNAAASGLVWPTRIEVRQPMFKRKAFVICQWERLGCLWDVLATSGVWDPLEGTSYATWKPSVEALWGNRGTANLASRLADGVIVDLVEHPHSALEIGSSGGSISSPVETWELPALIPTVTETTSWRDYAAKLEVVREEQTTMHYPAQAVTDGEVTSGVGTSYTVAHPALRERHGEPKHVVKFSGHAERIGFVPSVPSLVSVGNQPLLERERKESRQQLSTLCGQPLYRTEWTITYDAAGYIEQHDPPPIPAELTEIE